MASEFTENWNRRRLGRYGKAGQKGQIHKHCVDKLFEVDFIEHEEAVKKADRLTLLEQKEIKKEVNTKFDAVMIANLILSNLSSYKLYD